MKIKSEDILKPGAVLKVEKIDFNDPEIKRLFAETRRAQERIMSNHPRNWTQEQWQSLYNVITI